MKNYYIKNIRIIDANQDRVGSIFVENGEIAKDQRLKTGDYNIIDGTDKILMPGWFDPHVHFRQPGFEHKENFRTGSRAAVSAGVTSFFDMPNTKPATFTTALLEEKRNFARENSVANFGLYFGAGIGNIEEIKEVKNVPGVKLYLNATTGNLKMDDENHWRKVFQTGKKVALHAEGETFFRAVEIWEEENFPGELHLCHASLASEIELIRQMKAQEGAKGKITVEVCPHHLFLTDEERKACGAFCCMKPELATEKDIEALWAGVQDGTVDIFATDHAPHTVEEKEASSNPEKEGPFGIPGVETFLPLLFTEFQKRNWDLKRLSEMTSQKTVEIFHIKNKKGKIEAGYDADLVLLDPNVELEIDPKKLFSKSKWSPFESFPISVKVEKTFVGGVLVYADGGFVEDGFRGKELNFES